MLILVSEYIDLFLRISAFFLVSQTLLLELTGNWMTALMTKPGWLTGLPSDTFMYLAS